jgi:1-acyl-sn-glycerol-3-phosphate acyltransferase
MPQREQLCNPAVAHVRLSPLGCALPRRWGDAAVQHADGLGPRALLADLFLEHDADPYGLDPVRTKRAFFLVAQTVCRYFRLQTLGAEQIPPGRALVVGCHSGVLPWDAACLVVAIYRHTHRFSRNAGDWMFGRCGPVERFLTARGVVISEPERLAELLRRDEIVVLFPGGAKDMTRPFWERYRVKPHRGFAPGRGGYIKVALATSSPIVPVAIVGAEETHFLVRDLRPLARVLGLPYAPLVLSPFPLPARFYIRFGAPLRLNAPPAAASDQSVVDCLNIRVRQALQDLIDDTRRRRRGIYWSSLDTAAGEPPPHR